MAASADNLIWIDLEMTGLDPDRDRIIEIATVVTDPSLNVVAEWPVIAVHQTDDVLAAMDDWNRTTDGGSGLLERVRRSESSVTDAEQRTLAFLQLHSCQAPLRCAATASARIAGFSPDTCRRWSDSSTTETST